MEKSTADVSAGAPVGSPAIPPRLCRGAHQEAAAFQRVSFTGGEGTHSVLSILDDAHSIGEGFLSFFLRW